MKNVGEAKEERGGEGEGEEETLGGEKKREKGERRRERRGRGGGNVIGLVGGWGNAPALLPQMTSSN